MARIPIRGEKTGALLGYYDPKEHRLHAKNGGTGKDEDAASLPDQVRPAVKAKVDEPPRK